MKRGEDWLTGDARNDVPVAQKEVQRAREVEFAQLYLCFVDDPRGRALLDHWTATIEDKDVPPSASHAEFAYHEAKRNFIRGIHRQIKLANTEGKGK